MCLLHLICDQKKKRKQQLARLNVPIPFRCHLKANFLLSSKFYLNKVLQILDEFRQYKTEALTWTSIFRNRFSVNVSQSWINLLCFALLWFWVFQQYNTPVVHVVIHTWCSRFSNNFGSIPYLKITVNWNSRVLFYCCFVLFLAILLLGSST